MKYETVVLYDLYLGQDRVTMEPMSYKAIRREYGNGRVLRQRGFNLIPSVYFKREKLYGESIRNIKDTY